MERKIIYVINPISGTRGKSSLQELISRRTREQKIAFSILPTNAAGRYDFLLPLIEKEQITDIVVCGGDGTVSAVAAALAGTDIRIGIIPMGSGNGLAFAAGIPRNPSKALDLIFAAKASCIDGFTINDRFSCMLCGIGFDARVAHEFARQRSRGLQTYIRVSLRHFFSIRPHLFRIRLPLPPAGRSGEHISFPVEAFFISIANGNQFGNHFTIAPKASLDDGMLDIVIARKTGKLSLVLSVLRQVLGGNTIQDIRQGPGKKNILYFRASELSIENGEVAPLHIDGDPAPTAKEFIIRIVPQAFRLIQA
jgi:YegS/Rv2252/BmrU family lipid kinase